MGGFPMVEESALVVAIVGGGVMGEAMSRALLARGHCVRVAEPSEARRRQLASALPGLAVHAAAQDVGFARGAHVLLVAVKPHYAAAALSGVAAPALVISIMAGVDLATLRALLPGAGAVVRAMPNTAAAVGCAATVYTWGDAVVAPAQQRAAEAVLGALGVAVAVPGEHFIDYGTGLIGSGPAFVFLVMEAFMDAGVELGFPRADAVRLVEQLFRGCAAVVEAGAGAASVAQLRWNVTSPGGTTAAGLAAMEEAGLRTAVRAAVRSAAAKAAELGQRARIASKL